jgi:hypothetical protein
MKSIEFGRKSVDCTNEMIIKRVLCFATHHKVCKISLKYKIMNKRKKVKVSNKYLKQDTKGNGVEVYNDHGYHPPMGTSWIKKRICFMVI